MRCCCSAVAVCADCATAPNSWPMAARRFIWPGVGALGDHVPRWGLDLLGCRTALVGQLEKLLAALGFACGDQALVVEQLQRRVDRAGAGSPDSVAAFGDLLDHLVAVHRPLGQQHQNRRSHVAAPATAAATTAPSAARTSKAGAETESATEAGAEARAKARAKTRAEAGAVMPAGVIAEVFAEFSSGLPPGPWIGVQGTPIQGAGPEAESEAWPAGEWHVARSEWVAHVCSP